MPDVTGVRPALSLGTRAVGGAFTLDLRTGTWWWSDEVYAIHGFAPHEVVPTTELLLAHKHPDDRERVLDVLDRATRTGAAFSCVHRIRDAQGRDRVVTVVGEGVGTLDGGGPAELHGFFVDVTDVVHDEAQAAATTSIAASAQSRASIDQACGVLALTYGTDPEAGFAMLRAASNDANVPLRVLAAAIVGALPALHGQTGRVTAFLDGLLAPSHRLTSAGR